jgi:hypothetical protein
MYYIHPYLTNPAAAGGSKSLDSINFMLFHLVSVVGPLDDGHGFSGVYAVWLYPVPLHNNKIVNNICHKHNFYTYLSASILSCGPGDFGRIFGARQNKFVYTKKMLFYTPQDFERI